ncbi:MAG: hypothetical protein AAB605_02420 [Patescibacteria group bacterium]
MTSRTRSMTKFKASLKHFPLVLVILVSLAFVGFALAQETSVDAGVNASVEVQTDSSSNLIKPLDLIRKAKAVQQNIRQNAMEAKQELRADTKMQLQGAQTPGEKKDILQNAVGARVDIAKDRLQATAKLRSLVRIHAGLIKERFVLAVRQFERLIARVESRIEKLKAEGVATASVEAKVEVATTAVATAQADAQAVAAYIESVNDTSDRETVKTELRALIKTAQASIKAAHAALKEAVRELVSLNKTVHANTNASASSETTGGSTSNQ